MSVIVIGGGGSRAAINKLVESSPNMTAIQRAMAEAIIAKIDAIVPEIEALVAEVKSP